MRVFSNLLLLINLSTSILVFFFYGKGSSLFGERFPSLLLSVNLVSLFTQFIPLFYCFRRNKEQKTTFKSSFEKKKISQGRNECTLLIKLHPWFIKIKLFFSGLFKRPCCHTKNFRFIQFIPIHN